LELIKLLYMKLFNFLVKGKSFSNHESFPIVHRMLSAVLLTSVLMWSYAFNSYFYIPSPLLVKVGFICATLHLLSLILYKFTNSIRLATHSFVFFGFIFQFTHAFYTGGFFSNTVIWFSILPLLVAIILGKKALIGWSTIGFIAVGILFSFNHHTVNIITEEGRIWSQLNIGLGYIFLNLLLMFVFLSFEETTMNRLSAKNESIKKLLRVVSHDIANPLTVTMTSSEIIKKHLKKGSDVSVIERYINKINKSATMIAEILDHTRSLDSIDIGMKSLNIGPIFLNEIIENSLFIFNEKMKQKDINFSYDFDKNKNIKIMAEKISIMNEVFNNLFSNSIKFLNHNGELSIDVEATKNFVTVYFKDTGIGMDQKTLANLFRPDIKTTNKGTQGEAGTGFGMTILHTSLQAFGASVKVTSKTAEESPDNHGTIFELKFMV